MRKLRVSILGSRWLFGMVTGVSKSGPWFGGIPYTHGLYVTLDNGATTFVANETYKRLWWFVVSEAGHEA